MLFRQLLDAESSTYTYLLADPRTREALLIDPVREQVDRDLALLEELGLTLRYVLETHLHADHVTGAGLLRECTGARVMCGPRGAPCADIRLGHGEVLPMGEVEVEVLETPGHTADGVCYRVGARVFTGGTLLVRATGRTDVPDDDAAALQDSLARILFGLPDETEVWPGHDATGHRASTIGEERRHHARAAGRERLGAAARGASAWAPPARTPRPEALRANRSCGLLLLGPRPAP